MYRQLPDAVADALGQVVAGVRKDFERELDCRAADQRAHMAELRLASDSVLRSFEDRAVAIFARIEEKLATVRDGEPGPQGEAGNDADPELVAKLVRDEVAPQLLDLIPRHVADEVQRAVAELPPAERGEAGPQGEVGPAGPAGEIGQPGPSGEKGEIGPDGRDGKDFDPQVLEATVIAHVTRAVAELPPARDGVDGKDGRDGVDGLPGPRGEQGSQGDQGPPGSEGEKGEPGSQGERGDPGAAGERGEKGMDGTRGDPGEKGMDGAPGRDGANGTGLAGALINRSGELVVTLTDGTTRELGMIVGKDGAPGERGDPGRDGLDGVGFDDLEIIDAGERAFTIRCARGDNVKEWTLRKPGFIDRGVYKPGEKYEQGDAVSFGGSLWLAQAETGDKPGSGEGCGWRLAVKSGRPGKDGVGEKGEKGDPGRPGRDWTAQGLK